jgi:very-short-patch-repair endonuclease
MRVEFTDFSRDLRSRSTDAETALWHAVRNRRLLGFKFRRQVPKQGYVADFLCPSARLIVEVDGGQHALRTAEDNVRTKQLEQDGYRVLRFWNNDVLNNLEGVLTVIAAELANHAPSPQPSPQGGEGDKSVPSPQRGEGVNRDRCRSVPSPRRGEGQGEGAA